MYLLILTPLHLLKINTPTSQDVTVGLEVYTTNTFTIHSLSSQAPEFPRPMHSFFWRHRRGGTHTTQPVGTTAEEQNIAR